MAEPLRLLTVIGARPQIIKAAALSRAIRTHFVGRIEETLLHTGQHYDSNMSQVFFDELGIPAADVQLGVGSGPHGAMTARMIEGIEEVLGRKAFDVVVLYGDTNSTLAGALAASKLHVPVAHIEAGLRSFNKRMPEELNRVLCDHASTWLFCPTDTAVQNLGKEGISTRPGRADIDRPKVVLSGDVMYDNSLYFSELAKERSTVLADLSIGNGEFILVTVHRDHNTDDRTRLNAIYRTLLDVHTETGLAFVVPVHPRTRKMMDELMEPELLRSMRVSPGFHLIDPVGFFDMIALESGCRLVVTDSGGVQKEAYFFNRPCVVLRAETEWVELVGHGQAILADADPQRIRTAVDHFLRSGAPDCPPIFGDGHAAERICHELIETL
jgi:UDP-GlcNAc3NAcA epimerase